MQIIGDNIASPLVTTKAIMGYLMMNDYLIKDYTNKTLKLVKQNLNILDSDDPSIGFISNSNNLLILLENIKPIMHYLSDVKPQKIFYPKISLNYELIQIEQMDKKIIILTSEAFYDIIRKAWDTYKANDIDKIAVLYQDILSPTRINSIDNLKIALLESGLRQEFKGLEILILVNYYFFRELDDKFRNKISNIEDLKNILEKDFISTPFIFVILDNSCPQVEKILDKLYSDILSNFMSFFESIDIRVRSRKRK